MTDRSYDSKANREACRERGIVTVIPYRSNSKSRTKFFPKLLYGTRARVDPGTGKLKRFRRVAMRCEKTATNYDAIVSFACILMWVKSVHAAWRNRDADQTPISHSHRRSSVPCIPLVQRLPTEPRSAPGTLQRIRIGRLHCHRAQQGPKARTFAARVFRVF
jgi:hypothetical protein